MSSQAQLPHMAANGALAEVGAGLVVGSVVELTGLPEKLDVEDLLGTTDGSDLAPINPNGQKGKVVGFDEERCIVETFSAVTLAVARENAKAFTPKAPASGGFHLVWPADDEVAVADFAVAAIELLMSAGYCVVQMSMSDATRREALEEASTLKYHRMKKEFEAAYLGRQFKCKTAWLEELADTKEELFSALDRCDVHFSNFTKFMLPLAPCALDFIPYSRTNAMVRTPFENLSEEGKFLAEEVDEEDIGDGLVDSHISFVKRKTLCMLFVIETQGGELTLIPKDDTKENIVLELTAGRLIVFPHNTMSYVYKPFDRKDLVLQSWILQEPETLTFVGLAGDQTSKDEARGIHVGPNTPLGRRTNAIGISLGLPGSAHGELDAYWALVASCTDGLVKCPYSRFDMDVYSKPIAEWFPGTTYTWHGGFVCEDIYALDNECFGVSEEEVVLMAPAQRCLLEKGYEALYKCGLRQGPSLNGRKMGMFVGHSGDDWSFTPLFTCGHEDKFRHSHGARVWSTLTGRIAYTLGIKGPQSLVDTACSSALCAYGIGHTMLRQCEEDQRGVCMQVKISEALMMGSNILPGPGGFISCCGPHMLSTHGRCFTFDSSADGFARGEGTGAFVARNEDVMSEEAYASVIGSCLNQDGRSASMTAPNGPAQQECIKGSMREAGLSANQVTCAECHGTGTALGDPIEVGALRGVMQDRVVPIYQTSSKAHIGHLEACAGLAGLVKCMMMCSAAAGSPNCHLFTLNAHLDVTGYPTTFSSELSDFGFNTGYSGVSSFGFGGANSRADVFAPSKRGPHRTGELDWKQVDYITVTCPIDQGPMHWLDGRCVPRATSKNYVREPYRADAIRDEFASYDYNSSLYSGIYQLPPRDGAGAEDAPKGPIFIVGSWNQWREAHEMEEGDDDTWTFYLPLGETRHERFQLRENNNPFETIYPIVEEASTRTRVLGPDEGGADLFWLLDGRDAQVPVGTMYKITFQWGEPPTMHWEQVPDAPVPDWFAGCEHFYSVVASWTGGQFEFLEAATSGGEKVWETSVRMGMTGMEWFRFSRDSSPKQLIYPFKSGCSEDVAVCGPDDLCNGRCWRLRGKAGESVTLRLQVVNCHVTVSIVSNSLGTRVMHSVEGPKRHTYTVAGTFTDWKHQDMVLDEESLATFTYRGRVGDTGYEHFYISIDSDPSLSYFPEASFSYPGYSIVRGPAPASNEKLFTVPYLKPGAEFEIVFDRHAEDKRKIVSFRWIDGRIDTDSMKAAFHNYRSMGVIPPGLMVDTAAALPF
uniref:Type I polyketide synthase n=1 Tax=Gambierdiscus excentricus TaxID=986170 RepID=A0A1S6K842_9DINO|nr:type I polyketide synthase [Gambierdiscus excentricus]